MPQLTVASSQSHQLIQGDLIIFECIDTGPNVVDKANCLDVDRGLSIIALVLRAMGSGVVHIKQGTANE